MLFEGETGWLNPGSVGLTQVKKQGGKIRLPFARALIVDFGS